MVPLFVHIHLPQLPTMKAVSTSRVVFLIACCIEPYGSSLCTYTSSSTINHEAGKYQLWCFLLHVVLNPMVPLFVHIPINYEEGKYQ